jgi:hypothetical protein
MALHKEGKARIGAGPNRLPSRRRTRRCPLNNPSGRKTAQPWRRRPDSNGSHMPFGVSGTKKSVKH